MPNNFTCPRCGATSYHPDDVRQGYCGDCHWWTGDAFLGRSDVIEMALRDGAIEPLEMGENAGE